MDHARSYASYLMLHVLCATLIWKHPLDVIQCVRSSYCSNYVYYYGTSYSCTPDKDIRVFHLCLQILSHPCYLTQDRIKIMCIQCIGCIGSLVSTLSSDFGFYSPYVKNDVTLCKLDVNVKNRTAVAGSVDFFQLQ